MTSMKGVLVAIGAIVLVVGLLGAFSILPGLTVTGSASNGQAAFSWSVTNLTASITDSSKLPATGCTTQYCTTDVYVVALTLSFGAGSNTTAISIGSSHSYTYTSSGTRTIQDSLTYHNCISPSVTAKTQHEECGNAVNVASANIVVGSGATTGQSGSSSISPAFTLTNPSLHKVVANDSSTAINATLKTGQFSWGDGTGTTPIQFFDNIAGGPADHTYAKNGTYLVMETVFWTATGNTTLLSDNYATNYTVGTVANNTNTNTCSGDCFIGTSAATTPFFTFNVGTAGLIIGGLALIVVAFMPGNPPVRIVVFIVILVAGLAVGYFIGGPGPLLGIVHR